MAYQKMSELKQEIENNKENSKICGLVMPISGFDGCPDTHWVEVKAIITEAIESAGFTAHMVSDADDVGVIQKRIIQNLYENPIVICDVSGKNPNVMFELGMRLAFDKPTIIIKDDKTSYSFDTAAIEHLEYPRDLRFSQIVAFKKELSEKTQATYRKSTEDSNYTTFLKNFGTFTVPKLDTKEVSEEKFVLSELSQLREEVSSLIRVTRLRHREDDISPDKARDLINRYLEQNISDQLIIERLSRRGPPVHWIKKEIEEAKAKGTNLDF